MGGKGRMEGFFFSGTVFCPTALNAHDALGLGQEGGGEGGIPRHIYGGLEVGRSLVARRPGGEQKSHISSEARGGRRGELPF